MQIDSQPAIADRTVWQWGGRTVAVDAVAAAAVPAQVVTSVYAVAVSGPQGSSSGADANFPAVVAAWRLETIGPTTEDCHSVEMSILEAGCTPVSSILSVRDDRTVRQAAVRQAAAGDSTD